MELIPHVIDGQEVESVSTGRGSRPSTRGPVSRGRTSRSAAPRTPTARSPRPARRSTRARGRGWATRNAAALLHRLADLMAEHADELALADTVDMGKPVSDAQGKDVPRTAQNFRFFADHARLVDRRGVPDGHRPPRLRTLRAGRRRRRDRAVELPAHARVVEGRARARVGQHRRPQAGRGHPGVGDDPRPARARGRAARRACSTSCTATGRTRRARRSPRTAASTGSPSPASRAPGGRSSRAAVREPRAGEPRARRQGREHRLRRRRPRQRRRLVDQGDLPQRRPGLPRGLAAVRAARHLRRVRRARSSPPPRRCVIGDPKDPATEFGPLASARSTTRRSARTSTSSTRRAGPRAEP